MPGGPIAPVARGRRGPARRQAGGLRTAAAAGALLLVLAWAAAGLAAERSSQPVPNRPAARARKADHGNARAALTFSRALTADCMLHHAWLVRIANTDPERAVRVVLVSYTGRTRSQGASVKVLPPKSAPVALGCDGVSGLKRRWRIERAGFVAR